MMMRIAPVLGLGIIIIAMQSPLLWAKQRKTAGSDLVAQEADKARQDFLSWFHKDAIAIIHPELRDMLVDKLFGGPDSVELRSQGPTDYRDYNARARDAIDKKLLSMDSILDRDTQACLLASVRRYAGKNPKLVAFLKTKGIEVRPEGLGKPIVAFLFKNYPKASCTRSIALDEGYFLNEGAGCGEDSPEPFSQRMSKAELPFQLAGDALSVKEKALAYANIAYLGEWAWDALHEKHADLAAGYRSKAADALKRLSVLLPESKKWNDLRLKALDENVGSVMRDCVAEGD